MKLKGKSYGTGHRYNPVGTNVQTPSNVPSLTTSPIQFFTLMDLEHPVSADCTFKTVPYKTPTANWFMHKLIRVLPTNTWLKSKLDLPEAMITDDVYLHALEYMRQVIQSSYERFIQGRGAGGWINCESQFVLPVDQHLYTMPHHLPPDLDRYRDLVRVLRYRPAVQTKTKHGLKQDIKLVLVYTI
jgi:hypothetical protein